MEQLEQLLQEQAFLDAILNYKIKIIDKETRFWMIRTKKGYFYNEFVSNNFIALAWNTITSAFRYLIKPDDGPLKKILCISGAMVVGMVVIMSLYGACESAFHTGNWSTVPGNWLANIPRNFIMALPVQFLIAGPLVRRVFRSVFPEGKVLA